MLNTIFWLCVGMLFSFAVGRIFRSNRMFWLAILCVLAGFMCGTIAESVSNNNKDNTTVITKSMPIQSSMCSLQAIYSTIEHKDTRTPFRVKTVGKDKHAFDYHNNCAYNHKIYANPLLNYFDYFDTS